MSLQPEHNFAIPERTAQVAQAAFPQGNVYMQMRDELGPLFKDEHFVDLYPRRGQPAEAPWRLALVTIMQFAENLTDRQAANAVRGRIDWKYALGLALTDEGFHYSVLSEFRSRLVEGEAIHLLFQQMLTVFAERGLLKARGPQRTDSTHILTAVRVLNRLEMVGETLHHTLNVLAQVAPDWLQAQVPEAWFERYGQRFDEHRLPKNEKERLALAETIGQDGIYLLKHVYAEGAPTFLQEIPAVDILRRVWVQNFYLEEEAVHWRGEDDLPPASRMIVSPYDPEARYSSKRETHWSGYKVHLTETCDPDTPNLITNVETTISTDQDNMVVDRIHRTLKGQKTLPDQHIVDAGYVSADLLVESEEEYGIDLLGPVRPDVSWQARDEDAFDITKFTIDWENEVVFCPMGKHSRYWGPAKGPRGQPTIQVQFKKSDCLACAARARCTRSKSTPRGLTLQPMKRQLALQKAREREKTSVFKEQYADRAGVEGTISQAVDKLGMRRSRYRGIAKTHLHHVMTAAAMNLMRIMAWLSEKPRSKTWVAPFAALMSSM
jgi:transposase